MDPARITLISVRPLAYTATAIATALCVANFILLLMVWMSLTACMEPKTRFECSGSSNESRCPTPPEKANKFDTALSTSYFNQTQLNDACMDDILKEFNTPGDGVYR